MLQHNFQSIETINGNQPLLLNRLGRVWQVKSGSLAIFATSIIEGQPQGTRHYLFTVNSEEAVFGVGTIEPEGMDNPQTLLAVALEATELISLDLNLLSEAIANQQLEATELIIRWIKHLGQWLHSKSALQNQPTNNIFAESGSHYLSLLPGQCLIPDVEVIWIQVQQGYVRWLGTESQKLNSVSPPFPLVRGMWLQAEDQVELYSSVTTDLNSVVIAPSLIRLHQYFFYSLSEILQQETQNKYIQFQERNHLNNQVKQNSLASLAVLLQGQQDDLILEGQPLLVAAGAVGRAMGIKVLPPANSENLDRLKNPLGAIARASQFPTRRVLLSGKWWLQDSGPLLGSLLTTGEPIALLRDNIHQYVVFDPVTQTKTPVDETVAETISPEAYTFYRPLAKSLSKPLEVLQFAIKGYEKDAVLIIILGIIVSLLGMVVPQATAILINHGIPNGDRLLLWQMGLGLIAVAFGTTGFELAKGIVSLRVENIADSNLQLAVWDRILKLTPPFFRQYSTGDLIGRVMSVGEIRSQLSGATQRTLLSGVFALLNLGLMLFYSWKLTLVALGITVVMVTITSSASLLLIRNSRRLEELSGDIQGLTVQLINGVAKLRVAAAEERAFATWAKQYSRTTKIRAKIRGLNDLVSVVSVILSLISSILIYWFAVVFINSALIKGLPGLNLGTFLAFNSAYGTFFSGVSDLSNTGTNILEIVPLWERAQPILKSQVESDSDKVDPGRLTGQIFVDHLTFRYREDGPFILEDVTIRIEPGEFVAFVGASGSGKSTLFRLLLGFETPISGTIYYDNQDLTGLNIQALRRQLGVVLQSGRISAGSIFDNITGGALASLEEAWEASRMAGFAQDIEKMPMGMHTVVSEGGTNLSGGQRQRLLIARALISRPKILLMDEATSALDNQTQAIVTKSIDRLNATRIVIAHRLSTIRNADRIYVLEAGRVVQVGSFAELIKEDGLFAKLVARQLE